MMKPPIRWGIRNRWMALDPKLSKEEFIKALLTGLTTPPGYFPQNVLMNIKGYEALDKVMQRETAHWPQPNLKPPPMKQERWCLIRGMRQTLPGVIMPNSVNISIDGEFAQWVGEMIPDVKRKFCLLQIPDAKKVYHQVVEGRIWQYDRIFEWWFWRLGGIRKRYRDDPSHVSEKFRCQNTLPINLWSLMCAKRRNLIPNIYWKPSIYLWTRSISICLKFRKDKPFILHCAGGYRSMIAGSFLNKGVGIISGMWLADLLKLPNIPCRNPLCLSFHDVIISQSIVNTCPVCFGRAFSNLSVAGITGQCN